MTSAATPPSPAQTTDPAQTVRSFLDSLEAGRVGEAIALLDEEVIFINVSLPAIRGRRRVEWLFRALFERLGVGFRVYFHTIAGTGDTVLTERTDALIFGPVEQRIWVYGHFELREGKITLWRESFDWLDVMVGLLRGIAGVVSAPLNRPWPGD